MRSTPFVASSTCILCGRHIGERPSRSDPAFGFCPACAAEVGIVPTEDLRTLSTAELDALPFGWISLDSMGRVISFNALEQKLSGLAPERVIGRDFFVEIAPCTRVREFEGRYRELVAAAVPAVVRFSFHFRFAAGDRLVQIHLAYLPIQQEALLLVRSPDRT